MFEEEKYCGKCGAKKSQSFKYCLHCGAKYDTKPAYVKQVMEEEKPQVQESVHNIVKIQETKIEKEKEKPPVQKYCPKCGMEIIPEDKYCIECGHRKSSVYIPKNTDKNEFEEVKTSTNPIWTLLFILSIVNMVVFGWMAVPVVIIALIATLVDFADGIIPFIISAGYLGLSIYAIKYFSNKTSKKRR